MPGVLGGYRGQKRADVLRKLEAIAVERARRDPSTFIRYVVGYEQSEIHAKLQALLGSSPRVQIELPRAHGKTSQSVPRLAWEIGRNPNLRVKIVSESDGVAAGRAKALKEILQRPEYKRVFPHIEPGRTWADEKFSVKRALLSPDETVQAYGVRSSVIGGRADLILFDDVVGPEAIRSSAYRQNVREKMDNAWLLLLEDTGRAWYIDTPWHASDYSSELRAREGWSCHRFPVADFRPVWPEKWTEELLRKQKAELGSIAYARAYELRPMSDEDTPIKAEWFRFYEPHDVLVPSLYRFLGVDLAISKSRDAAYTAFVDVGKDVEGRLFVMRTLRRRMDFPEALAAFKSWTDEVQYRGIGVETVQFQRAFAQMAHRPKGAAFIEYPSVESKHERAAVLSVPIEKGLLHLRGKDGVPHASQQELFDECTLFPVYEYKDLLDALGYAVDVALSVRTGSRTSPPALSSEGGAFVGKREAEELNGML